MSTYLFYDLETTGLNKAFDQILQFAAIRTDADLNELERLTIRIRLRPDVVPSPQAIITNRISVSDFSAGVCEFEGIRRIHQLVNQPGTISLGYNSLGFDDGFLRFSFHRNLLPPYTHQYQNGCRRMDILPLAVIYRLFEKDLLNWPEVNGQPSLKLEQLSAANKLVSGTAHDAAVDVAATLALARIFFRKKKMWQYMLGYFEKQTDALRIQELPVAFKSAAGDHRLGLMLSSEYGARQNYLVPVLSIGASIPYNNQSLWLRLDLPALRETTPASVDKSTWVVRKRFGEPGIVLPPHDRYWKLLDLQRRREVEENRAWLQANTEILLRIVDYHRSYRYPDIPNLDADAALYQIGFLSPADEKVRHRFQTAAVEQKAELIDRFASTEARILAARVLARNYPQHLPHKFAGAFQAYLQRVNPERQADALEDYKGNRRITPVGALHEIHRLRQASELDAGQRQLLDELEHYLRSRFAQKT